MELDEFLHTFGLSDEEIYLMQKLGKEERFRQGEDVSFIGRHIDHFHFIKQGMIRSYRIIDGNDFTYNFFLVGDICVDYESLLKKVPSQSYFEVLAPTEVITFRFSKVEALFEEHPRIERIARKMAEFAYVRLVERVKEFQSDSLEQRYLNLISNQETLFHSAPLQHIASYLGVKPQSLSRVRAKIVKNS